MSLPIALTASVKLRIGSPKLLEMNKFVRTKSPTGSNFPKKIFQQLHTGWTVVVHLCCGFCLWCQMAPQQSVKFKTAFFGLFLISRCAIFSRKGQGRAGPIDTSYRRSRVIKKTRKQKHRPIKDNAYRQDLVTVHREGC